MYSPCSPLIVPHAGAFIYRVCIADLGPSASWVLLNLAGERRYDHPSARRSNIMTTPGAYAFLLAPIHRRGSNVRRLPLLSHPGDLPPSMHRQRSRIRSSSHQVAETSCHHHVPGSGSSAFWSWPAYLVPAICAQDVHNPEPHGRPTTCLAYRPPPSATCRTTLRKTAYHQAASPSARVHPSATARSSSPYQLVLLFSVGRVPRT